MSPDRQQTDELTALLERHDGPDAELARSLRDLARVVTSHQPVPNPRLAALLEVAATQSPQPLHLVPGVGVAAAEAGAAARDHRTVRRLVTATPAVTALVIGGALVAAASVGIVVHARTSRPPVHRPAPVVTLTPSVAPSTTPTERGAAPAVTSAPPTTSPTAVATTGSSAPPGTRHRSTSAGAVAQPSTRPASSSSTSDAEKSSGASQDGSGDSTSDAVESPESSEAPESSRSSEASQSPEVQDAPTVDESGTSGGSGDS